MNDMTDEPLLSWNLTNNILGLVIHLFIILMEISV